MTEEFCHNEPWDWAWSDLEKCHKTEDGYNADVRHPFHLFLGRMISEQTPLNITVYTQNSNRNIVYQCDHIHTVSAIAMVMRTEDTAIPISPVRCSDLRPARSTMNS